MVKNTQQSLPLRASTRHNDGRPIAVVSRTSWSESGGRRRALGASLEPIQDTAISSFTNHPRRGRRAAGWVDEGAPKVAVQPQPARLRTAQQLVAGSAAAAAPGASFAQSRIRHALDLFGACMMIVAFLAFAMFA